MRQDECGLMLNLKSERGQSRHTCCDTGMFIKKITLGKYNPPSQVLSEAETWTIVHKLVVCISRPHSWSKQTSCIRVIYKVHGP